MGDPTQQINGSFRVLVQLSVTFLDPRTWARTSVLNPTLQIKAMDICWTRGPSSPLKLAGGGRGWAGKSWVRIDREGRKM